VLRQVPLRNGPSGGEPLSRRLRVVPGGGHPRRVEQGSHRERGVVANPVWRRPFLFAHRERLQRGVGGG
jgi:hypothetical protein